MKHKRFLKSFVAVLASATMLVTSALPTLAADEISPQHTYTGGGFTFEKISHPNSPVEQADGIVDYVGNGSVAPYVAGESADGNGDRGQSYSYASAVYGDWVYINTMYGGLGVSSILSYGMSGVDSEVAKAMMDVMYNGHLYTGEPDGKYAGGVLLKFNVKTGETKLLMSRDVNGLIPTFRNACEMNGKLYFVGMVVDVQRMTPQEVATAIAMQNGLPCIYEVDPANDDKLTCIYDCVDMDGFRQLVADKVFTSTRAIGTYGDSLIVGGLDTDGVFLSASKDPSAGQESFSVIADMNDLFNYPAYHRTDVNGGGGIYQVIEYNGKLYVVICTGTPENKNEETGTLQTFAIVRGECNGDATDRNAWTWTVLAGDMENDGAKYPFGLDEERVSAGACTLQVYGDYLYIGDYNDVSSALQGFVLQKQFQTQATNLEQSINLYRMDENENVEMIVGDPTTRFPEGGSSGLGSGYGTHMSQYTWQTTVYEDKMYVSTMDTTTLLEPIAQFTNGDLLEMSPEEWESQINYIRVLLELLFQNEDPAVNSIQTAESDVVAAEETALTEDTADDMVDAAVEKASIRAAESNLSARTVKSVALTDDQKQSLVSGLLDESISDGQVTDSQVKGLTQINNTMDTLTELIDTTEIEAFVEAYSELLEQYSGVSDLLPESLKSLYDMLLSYATRDNLVALAKSVKYLRTSEAGFDLYEIADNGDGTVSINTVTTNGFGDRFNHGLRIFAKTSDYWVIGTANPFYGTQLWRTENTVKDPTDSSEPSDSSDPSDSSEPSDSSNPSDSSTPTDTSNSDNSTGSTTSTPTASGAGPKTGDTSNPMAMVLLMIGALGAAAGTTIWYRKRKSN